MANISRTIAASSTAGMIVLALGAGATPAAAAIWPESEKPALVRPNSQSTYSTVRYSDGINAPQFDAFAASVQNIFANLSKSQVSLGADFEAAIYGDLESLYEA